MHGDRGRQRRFSDVDQGVVPWMAVHVGRRVGPRPQRPQTLRDGDGSLPTQGQHRCCDPHDPDRCMYVCVYAACLGGSLSMVGPEVVRFNNNSNNRRQDPFRVHLVGRPIRVATLVVPSRRVSALYRYAALGTAHTVMPASSRHCQHRSARITLNGSLSSNLYLCAVWLFAASA